MDLSDRAFWQEFNAGTIQQFEETNGRPGGPFEGKDVLLLTYTGRKTGQEYTIPLRWYPDGDRVLVMAGKGGYHLHPEWYLSLVERPNVTVTIGSESWAATVVDLPEPERTAMYEKCIVLEPATIGAQSLTDRPFPVLALVRTVE